MKRSKHNLSSYKLLTCDMGQLIPCGLVEVLPGDTFQHRTSALVRLSPMAAPVMHPTTVRLHHFFVPHRLSWNEDAGVTFEDFITGGKDGKDATGVPTYGTVTTPNTLFDYFGLPLVDGVGVNQMPIRGFNLIYNEFYRDQDLITERIPEDFTVPRVSWEKDYFSTARPWAQKGDSITLPIGTKAPVHGIGMGSIVYPDSGTAVFETGQSGLTNFAKSANASEGVENAVHIEEDEANAGFPGIYADLSEATGVDINEVRKAFALQRFAEARARYGSRYTEYLRYIGVRSRDARLQRPEYLGGGRVNVSISEVLQTAPETPAGAAPEGDTSYGVGDLYGHGIAAARSNRYRRHFQEHGYVHSLFSVRPKAVYTNGIQRHWLRRFREDYFQKELVHIGQQEIFNSEVFADPTNVGHETWGYTDRYREYRETPSDAVGEFRELLNYWHMGRIFQSAPALNQAFIDCIPSKRIFNEQTQHSLWCLVQHSLVARRIVPRNAVPSIM